MTYMLYTKSQLSFTSFWEAVRSRIQRNNNAWEFS